VSAAICDRRVLGILLGTVSALTPAFVIIAYLPEILRTAGTLVVIAMLAYGAGQVTGTAVVPQLIGRPNARLALLLGASGVTVFTAALTATRTVNAGAIVTMAALGLAVGLTIVPRQHRLFATVPALAPVAVGLNGSAIYIGSALGAGTGGAALAIGGRAATITAAIIGALAVTIAAAIVSEHMTARKPAGTTQPPA
jgi:MFS transporter, DHA1 family, inner membrane transport protein